MQEKYIGSGNDSNVYVYTINDTTVLLKQYFRNEIGDILSYHKIQNLFANKKFTIPNSSYKHMLYKSQPITSAYFSVLYLDPKGVGPGSSLEGMQTGQIFSTLSYVPGDTLEQAGEKEYFSFAGRYKNCLFARGCLQSGMADVLYEKYPVFKKMCEEIPGGLPPYDGGTGLAVGWPQFICGAPNVKVVSFEDGVLTLCITDLGHSSNDFVGQYKYFSKKKKKS